MMLHSVQALQSLKIASKAIDLAGIRLVRSGVAPAASGVVGRILPKKGFPEGTLRASCCKAQLTAKPVRKPIVSQDPAALSLHADPPARTLRPATLWG